MRWRLGAALVLACTSAPARAAPPASPHRLVVLHSTGWYDPWIENDGFAYPVNPGVTQGGLLGYAYGSGHFDVGLSLEVDALLSRPRARLTTPSLDVRWHGLDRTSFFAGLGLAYHLVDNTIYGADPHTGESLAVHYSSQQYALRVSLGGTFASGPTTETMVQLTLLAAGSGESDQGRAAVTRRGQPVLTLALFLQGGVQFEL